MSITKDKNKKYIKKYPFLRAYNSWGNFSCWLDVISNDYWNKLFRKQVIKNLKEILQENNLDINTLKITSVKENIKSLCLSVSYYNIDLLYEILNNKNLTKPAYCKYCGKELVATQFIKDIKNNNLVILFDRHLDCSKKAQGIKWID